MVYITLKNNNGIKKYKVSVDNSLLIFNDFFYNETKKEFKGIGSEPLLNILFYTGHIDDLKHFIYLKFQTKKTYDLFFKELNKYMFNNSNNNYKKGYTIDNIYNTYF